MTYMEVGKSLQDTIVLCSSFLKTPNLWQEKERSQVIHISILEPRPLVRLSSFHLQAYAMNYWRKLGTPTDKLIMGFPIYGHNFHLLKESKNELQPVSM